MTTDRSSTHHLSRRQLIAMGLTGIPLTIAGVTSVSLFKRPRMQSRLLFSYRSHTNGTRELTWSPDGTRIASVSLDFPQTPDGTRPDSPWDSVIQVWDATTGKQLLVYRGHPTFPSHLSWSPDSTHLLSTDGNETHVWRASDGQLTWKVSAQKAILPWSPDGSHIVLQDVNDGNLHVYDTRTWTSIPVSWPTAFVSFSWSPDSTRIIGGNTLTDNSWRQYQQIAVWSASSGKVLWQITSLKDLSYLSGLLWSPDGTRVASCGTKPTVWLASNGGVRIWDATSGQWVLTYMGHSQSADLLALAWSPNGKYLASGDSDQQIQVWDAATGQQLLTYQGHHNWISNIAWSPDSTRIASGDFNGPIQVWQLTSL